MILDDIVARRREQLEREKAAVPPEEMKKKAELRLSERSPLSFERALKKERLSCICEVKKASPSKGLICADLRPAEFAAEYEAAGADAVSCLTEEYYFKGSSEYLKEIRQRINIPVLRKDFIFDEYQVFEAAAIGADAVLLIAAVLSPADFDRLFSLARSLGLGVLGEMHTVEEMKTYAAGRSGMVIGVNNRDLKTFRVDLSTAARLRPYAPEGAVFVSESGISTNADMREVRKNGADAVLIGEVLMRSGNITQKLRELRQGV